MKKQKDIEFAIREGEKKLTIQPSGRAWQKLERQLDRQTQRRQKNGNIVMMRRWLAVAATLLVLVVSLFTFSAGNEIDYRPTFVEELGGNNNCSPFCMNIEARKLLPAFYAVPEKDELDKKS